jgi:hypothetical protein
LSRARPFLDLKNVGDNNTNQVKTFLSSESDVSRKKSFRFGFWRNKKNISKTRIVQIAIICIFHPQKDKTLYNRCVLSKILHNWFQYIPTYLHTKQEKQEGNKILKKIFLPAQSTVAVDCTRLFLNNVETVSSRSRNLQSVKTFQSQQLQTILEMVTCF